MKSKLSSHVSFIFQNLIYLKSRAPINIQFPTIAFHLSLLPTKARCSQQSLTPSPRVPCSSSMTKVWSSQIIFWLFSRYDWILRQWWCRVKDGHVRLHRSAVAEVQNEDRATMVVLSSSDGVAVIDSGLYYFFLIRIFCWTTYCLKPSLFKWFSGFWPIFPIWCRFLSFLVSEATQTGWGSGSRFNWSNWSVWSSFLNNAYCNILKIQYFWLALLTELFHFIREIPLARIEV